MSSPRPVRPQTQDAIRITTAGSGRQADMARRQRNYAIAMSIRTICFIGAVTTGVAGIDWLWPYLIGGAIFLPYVAVVLANAGDSRSNELPLMAAGDAQRQLGPGSHGG